MAFPLIAKEKHWIFNPFRYNFEAVIANALLKGSTKLNDVLRDVVRYKEPPQNAPMAAKSVNFLNYNKHIIATKELLWYSTIIKAFGLCFNKMVL